MCGGVCFWGALTRTHARTHARTHTHARISYWPREVTAPEFRGRSTDTVNVQDEMLKPDHSHSCVLYCLGRSVDGVSPVDDVRSDAVIQG